MPTYHFRDKNTRETFEIHLSMSGREGYLKENPHMEQVLMPVKIVRDVGTNLRVDDTFRERLDLIKERHPKNTIKDY